MKRETTGALAGHVADGLGHTNPPETCRCAKKRALEDDVESALENIADGGGTVAEHAMLLARDHNLSFNEAVEIINKGVKNEAAD